MLSRPRRSRQEKAQLLRLMWRSLSRDLGMLGRYLKLMTPELNGLALKLIGSLRSLWEITSVDSVEQRMAKRNRTVTNV